MAANLICALSASRGHVGERAAAHFLPNTLNGAGADAALPLDR
jgi:hypothetical protein